MRWLPVLGRETAGSPLCWYLQYGGSAAVVISVFVVLALRRQPSREPVGVPALSVADRWAAGAVIGGCALAAAVQRVARFVELRSEAAPARAVAGDGWEYWGSAVKPYEVIPTLCFGAGAGLALGLVLYGVGVRMWRPVPASPGEAVVERVSRCPSLFFAVLRRSRVRAARTFARAPRRPVGLRGRGRAGTGRG